MSDLMGRLTAALDETERIATAASAYGQEWRYSESGIYPSDGARHPGAIISGAYDHLEDEYGQHIAHNDPARVLRRVARDRKVLARHEPERRRIAEQDETGWTEFGWHVCSWCTPNRQIYVGQRALVEWPCPDVRDLAEDYEIEVGSV